MRRFFLIAAGALLACSSVLAIPPGTGMSTRTCLDTVTGGATNANCSRSVGDVMCMGGCPSGQACPTGNETWHGGSCDGLTVHHDGCGGCPNKGAGLITVSAQETIDESKQSRATFPALPIAAYGLLEIVETPQNRLLLSVGDAIGLPANVSDSKDVLGPIMAVLRPNRALHTDPPEMKVKDEYGAFNAQQVKASVLAILGGRLDRLAGEIEKDVTLTGDIEVTDRGMMDDLGVRADRYRLREKVLFAAAELYHNANEDESARQCVRAGIHLAAAESRFFQRADVLHAIDVHADLVKLLPRAQQDKLAAIAGKLHDEQRRVDAFVHGPLQDLTTAIRAGKADELMIRSAWSDSPDLMCRWDVGRAALAVVSTDEAKIKGSAAPMTAALAALRSHESDEVSARWLQSAQSPIEPSLAAALPHQYVNADQHHMEGD